MPPPAEGFASRLFLVPALRSQPDRRLVKLVREGYEIAFEEIVRRYGRPLTRYAASIVGGRSEDVTQDAFTKALVALRREDAEIELRPWLFRIVRNTALNDLRDSPPSPELLAEVLVGGSTPAEELERREELANLMKRLRALPEPQRAAIVMRELEGLGHDEIAAALGMTGGAARQAIYRARRALRNGAGLLLPLPLLKALLAGAAPTAAEAAVGAAGLGGTAGAGVALKATAATVLVAGAVGTGAALDQASKSGDANAKPPPAPANSSSAGTAAVSSGAESGSGDGSNRGPGSNDSENEGEDGGESGEDRDDNEDRSGSNSGSGETDGSGSGSSGSGSGDSSGSGSGSGSSGSGDEESDDD